jgi:hypothetical protein
VTPFHRSHARKVRTYILAGLALLVVSGAASLAFIYAAVRVARMAWGQP